MLKNRKEAKVALIALAAVLVVSASAYAEYDQQHVVGVMRNNITLMGEINAAATAEDWVLAAQKLYAIADGMYTISKYDPPRGSKADWEATMGAFVNAAFVGIGACGVQDADGLQSAIAKLKGLNRQGHGAHK